MTKSKPKPANPKAKKSGNGSGCREAAPVAGSPHFFELLPMDLQVHVLQQWIAKANDCGDSLVIMLSAIDIACCNHSIRPLFLELARCRLFAWSTDQVFRQSRRQLEVRDLLSYSKWLETRQVRVTVLTVGDLGAEYLQKALMTKKKGLKPEGLKMGQMPFINSVLFSGNDCFMGGMTAVLAACPSIICLSVYADLADHLKAMPKLHVKELLLPNTTFSTKTMLVPFLHAGLETLVVGVVTVPSELGLLAKHCPQLQVLSLELPELQETDIQQLFEGCSDLRDLTLFTTTPADCLPVILQAAGQRRNLKSLCLDVSSNCSADFTQEVNPASVAEILNAHPWLSSLQLGELKINRQDGQGSLDLCVFDFSEATEIETLTQACSGVIKLELALKVTSTAAQNALGKHLGNALQDLSVNFRDEDDEDSTAADKKNYSPELRFTLPCCCPNLLKLELYGVNMTDKWLGQLARTCKQLQTLYFYTPYSNELSITDKGMAVLFAECRSLRQFGVSECAGITKRSLQSMMDADLHLRTFIWSDVGFNQEDVNKFCQVARKMQFLPVPVFIEGFLAAEV